MSIGKSRLEAFSDGVIAIIITIMVLEFKVPHGDTWAALKPLVPTFLCYVMSYLYVGTYWNNHHHLLHTLKHVTAGVLWANLCLLFCLSLLPFATAWMGENQYGAIPTANYGLILLASALSYYILQYQIVKADGDESVLKRALGSDIKGRLSIVLYAVAVVLAFYYPWVSQAIYLLVALMWFLPDRRIEKTVEACDSLGKL